MCISILVIQFMFFVIMIISTAPISAATGDLSPFNTFLNEQNGFKLKYFKNSFSSFFVYFCNHFKSLSQLYAYAYTEVERKKNFLYTFLSSYAYTGMFIWSLIRNEQKLEFDQWVSFYFCFLSFNEYSTNAQSHYKRVGVSDEQHQ